MFIEDIEKKVVEICEAEGIFQEKMKPHENFLFALKVTYPPGHPHPNHLVVVVPKNKQYISIELATKISPQHLDAFKKLEEQTGTSLIPLFFYLLRNMLLNRNLFYQFNANNYSYVFSEHIYFDGLTMNSFYQAIRKIYYASVSAQITINDVASGKFKGIRMPSKMEDTEESQGSPEDLFYS
ncbi:MAG: DUF2299 domain-containing protein [Promethearchaeota archaeon]|nr:MAG: DUF2299 domain-containing protein [Candidatus Lokiarchaeota archaeon]